MFKTVLNELRAHAPYTLLGTLTGMMVLWISLSTQLSHSMFETLFWVLHPSHVFFSALVTTAMYRRHTQGKIFMTLAIGYLGSVGIGTLSDCIIPYIGEILLEMPNRGLHLGFIEKWWLVNPLAFAGIGFACWRQETKFPHAGHVLLSTWASLFHMVMALGTDVGLITVLVMALFLFLAVWIPCCTSDIVFPLLFAVKREK
ncbi:MAG: hypothetical protein PHI99_09755 [Syntrophales bacterium]|nr:hypothetical protein [Syntrophales bacterium]